MECGWRCSWPSDHDVGGSSPAEPFDAQRFDGRVTHGGFGNETLDGLEAVQSSCEANVRDGGDDRCGGEAGERQLPDYRRRVLDRACLFRRFARLLLRL